MIQRDLGAEDRTLGAPRMTASVVIACHTEERWSSLLRAISSVLAQDPAPAQVIIAVDHNPDLCERLRAESVPIALVDHRGIPGASATRNAGVASARSALIAFVDDDVRARPGWLANLLEPFGDPRVVGSGGLTLPAWQGSRPRWFPGEFGWVVGASYLGLPADTAPVRNVWSENMAVRREAFERVGGFRSGFGKLGHSSRPEDTDLCIRVGSSSPGSQWLYVPAAVVEHEVPHERATLSFFLRRCYSEGAGKVEMSRHLGEQRDLGAERSYLLRTLPRAAARALREAAFSRVFAIVAGTAAAAAGAAVAVGAAARTRVVGRLPAASRFSR
jgi:glucosyl-dolichyl phosphate glucuronosyltransferase